MWRTWETAPTIAALAQQGWDVDVDVGAEEDGENEAASAAAAATAATATATDTAVSPDLVFYSDWCGANFGASTASTCAALFLSVDSFSSLHKPGTGVTPKGAKLPRNGQVVGANKRISEFTFKLPVSFGYYPPTVRPAAAGP